MDGRTEVTAAQRQFPACVLPLAGSLAVQQVPVLHMRAVPFLGTPGHSMGRAGSQAHGPGTPATRKSGALLRVQLLAICCQRAR